jgi:hypothetical protein
MKLWKEVPLRDLEHWVMAKPKAEEKRFLTRIARINAD